ncbi:MAG: hypothetical protein ABW023_03115 [Sphingomonas sp.]
MKTARIAPGKAALASLWALAVIAMAVYAGRQAYAAAPMGGGGEALAARLDAQVRQGAGSKIFDKETEKALIGAVRDAPLNVRYARLLSMAVAARGEADRSRQLLHIADRISRRDVLTQLGMIEDAVQRDKIGEALDHYEIVLTVTNGADNIVFPVLVGALDEAEIRYALAVRVRQASFWRERFLNYAIGSAPPRLVAPLLTRWSGDRETLQSFQARLLDSYVAKKDYEGAFRFVTSIGRAPGLAGAFGFSPGSLDSRFGPLSWQLGRDNGIEAVAERERVQIYLAPDSKGTVASRLLQLAPGRYSFSQLLSSSGEPDARISWNWECLRADGATGFKAIDVRVGQPHMSLRENIDIPQGCQAVRVRLDVSTGSFDGQPELELEKIDLVRA